jgi:hypothetical protein
MNRKPVTVVDMVRRLQCLTREYNELADAYNAIAPEHVTWTADRLIQPGETISIAVPKRFPLRPRH